MENQEVEYSEAQQEMIRRGAEETEKFLRDPFSGVGFQNAQPIKIGGTR